MAAPDSGGISPDTQNFVVSLGEIEEIRKKYEIENSIKLVCLRKTRNFGKNTEVCKKTISIRWNDPTGTVRNASMPYVLQGTYELGCMFGRDKHAKDKRRRQQDWERQLMGDHPVANRRKKIYQSTKKKGCKASIIVREVLIFPQFKSKTAGRKSRTVAAKKLKAALQQGDDAQKLEKTHRLFFHIPECQDHNHKLSTLIGLSNPLSDEVKNKIMSLVMIGVTSVSEMRRHIRQFVRNISPVPLETDLSYYPMDDTIRRYMYTCQQRLKYSQLDQENVIHMVAEYGEKNPDDNITFIPATAVPEDNEYNIEEVGGDDDDEVVSSSCKPVNTSFFFCHQTKYQRHLLRRYGNDICLLDATYRTTKYALPLFFMAVKTNVGYSVVGEFIVENESKASIKQGLQTIKSWIDQDETAWDWRPQFFMTDFCEAEINAVEEIFQDTTVILCDFHREQSWSRWLSKSSNGLAPHKDKVMAMLRRCAHAISVEEYNKALNVLQSSQEWASSPKLRSWFSRKWMSEYKRWVWLFRLERRVMVNTNNGLERQNKVFKYTFLEQRKTNSLAGMINILLTEYLPAMIKRYMKDNISASQTYGRLYQDYVPDFLHDRPAAFVRHCMDKLDLAQLILRDEIQVKEKGFEVGSQTDGGKSYQVQLDTGYGLPHCTCHTWSWTRMPCKHMFSVIQHFSSWDLLPTEFKDSPFFTLDDAVMLVAPTYSNGDMLLEDTDTDVTSIADENLPVSQKTYSSNVRRKAALCREKLSLLTSNTYLCNDESALHSVASQLQETLDFLTGHLHCEDGLLTGEDENVQKAASKRIRKQENPKKRTPKPRKTKNLVNKGLKRKVFPQKVQRVSSQINENVQDDSAQQQEQCCSKQMKINDLLQKAKEMKKSLEGNDWIVLTRKAEICKTLTVDIVAETAYSVLKGWTDDEQIQLLQDMKMFAPNNMSEAGKLRLSQTILYMLANKGMVSVEYNVEQRRHEMSEAMKSLAEAAGQIGVAGEQLSDQDCGEPKVKKRKNVHFADSVKSSFKKSKQEKKVPKPYGGLLNKGNICFANASLQCFRQTEILTVLMDHPACDAPCFLCNMRNFFDDGPVSAEKLCIALQDVWPQYKFGQQEDAAEFIVKTLSEIYEKCLRNDSAEECQIEKMFYGSLEVTLNCTVCAESSVCKESFNHLSISMKIAKDLQEALGNFFEGETIDNVHCKRCDASVDMEKHQLFSTIPKYIVIQLKRFKANGRKDGRNFIIPHNLRLRKYVSHNKTLEDKAKLHSFIVHRGTHASGHYVAYIEKGMNWFEIDDMKIRMVTREELENSLQRSYVIIFKALPRPYID